MKNKYMGRLLTLCGLLLLACLAALWIPPALAGPIRDQDLQPSAVTAGTYGSASTIPSLTVNAEGIVTAASGIAIGFQVAVAPSAVSLSTTISPSGNVVTASASYGSSAVQANGVRHEWQVAAGVASGASVNTVAVSGAGTSAVNGAYTPSGTYNGHPEYVLGSVAAIEYDSFNNVWDILLTGVPGTQYFSATSSISGTYHQTQGTLPAPSVTGQAFAGPDGTPSTYWTGDALVSGQDGVLALTTANSPLTFQVRSRGDYAQGGTAPTPSSWVQSSSLSFLGPACLPVNAVVVTGTYTAVANVDDFIVVNAASASGGVVLPDPTNYSGPIIRVSRNDASSTYSVTVTTAGSGKVIVGSNSITSQYQTKAYVRLSDGSGWYQD